MFALVLILLAAQPAQATPPEATTNFADLALTLTLPQLADSKESLGADDDQVRGSPGPHAARLAGGALGTLTQTVVVSRVLAFGDRQVV